MDGIRARFRLERPGFALDVDLALPGRGVSALFGPSGSGKTTLLRCLAGLERPREGRLDVLGECWQDGGRFLPPHRRPVGYVFQEASLFPHLSVLGNLRYGQRRSRDASKVDLDHAIGLLGIASLLDRRPEHLSGGERQRVAIARALAVGPRLLLLDEPLAALDAARRREILPYLERLHETLEIPVLYVSHSAAEVARLADHVVLLEAGRVRAEGPLQDLCARLDPAARLGEQPGVVLEAVLAERAAQWHLARVEFAGGSLWTRDFERAPGSRVRVQVLARDVSLALQPPQGSSIQNQLPGVVDAIGEDEHPGLALVRVRVGASALLARVTRRAVAELGIAPGQALWAQVKSVALMD
ncbi:molybdenum ABC transporter ATP-binding protein [Vulcaniibacterium gelatinicum]|uniref:molybdenum ABC transporter ATP-binding protein n=1 Tax=Vulcaniibacterium gelatinicum TaxID=2598725 RepID=UPI0011CB3B26|nr:molybdenum ABC transporter ATP-binding protein [Vulcaniibacterium gelatinicum]